MLLVKLVLLFVAFLFCWAGSASYLFAFTSEEDGNEGEAQTYRNGFRGLTGVGLLIAFIAGVI